MKLHELDYTDGKKYRVVSEGVAFGLDIVTIREHDLFDEGGDDITDYISLYELSQLEFKEVNDYNTPTSFMDAYAKVEAGKPSEYVYARIGNGALQLYKHPIGGVMMRNSNESYVTGLSGNWIREKV